VGHLTAFYFGHNLELLFDSWQITTPAGRSLLYIAKYYGDVYIIGNLHKTGLSMAD